MSKFYYHTYSSAFAPDINPGAVSDDSIQEQIQNPDPVTDQKSASAEFIHPDLADRLVELETKVAFQDETIEELSNVIASQSADLEKMKIALRYLQSKLKECNISNVALPSEETPPPHY